MVEYRMDRLLLLEMSPILVLTELFRLHDFDDSIILKYLRIGKLDLTYKIQF